MAEKKASNDRAKMEGVLLIAQLDLTQFCELSPPGTKRQLKKRVNALHAVWNNLMDAHVSYCSLAGKEMGSVEGQTYLKELQIPYSAVLRKADELLDEEEADIESEKTQRGVDIKRDIALMQLDISEIIKCLTTVLEAPSITGEALKEAGEMMRGLEKKLREEYKTLAGRLGEGLDKTEAEVEKNKADKFMLENIPKLGDLRTKLMMKTPRKEEASSFLGAVQRATGTNKEEKVTKQRIKTAPVPVPKWDGKSRSYPRFKKMWEENIIPYHEPSALHLMLVQALPGDVLDEISSLASSYEVIWDHLEMKAGKAEVVARDIMGELMALSHNKYGKKFLAKFSAILEDSEALLVTIGMQDWLTSSRSVSELEDLLPYTEKIEWAKKVKGAIGLERFEKFKIFLRDRKEELEALDTIGSRKVSQVADKDPICTYCNKRGHIEMEGDVIICRAKKQDISKSGGKSASGGRGFESDFKNGCAICGNPKHWKNECPDKGTDRDNLWHGGPRGRGRGPPPGKGGGYGRGQGGAQSDGAVNSNQLRTSDCNRCKFAPSNLTSCIGCKKNNNIDHCLLHCGQFLCLGVEDRVKLVKAANGCVVCLHTGHQAASCNYKDKSNWICGISGCRSHHHPTLHGSTDVFVKVNTISVAEQDRFEDVTDWEARADYLQDSYLVNEHDGKEITADRQDELREAKEELKKPGLNGDQVLLVIMEVSMVYGPQRLLTSVVTFFDDGSTCSIILNSVAKQYGLLGEKVVVTIETINAITTKETMIYLVELVDRKGARQMVKAFGFDSISEPVGSVELEGVKYLFSAEMQEQWLAWGVRPAGAVQLLVGSEVAHLHPRAEEVVNNMVIKTSIFGTGLVLNGGNNAIQCKKMEFDSTVAAIRQGKFVKVNRTVVKYTQVRDFTQLDFVDSRQCCGVLREKDFLAAEGMGVEAPKRCKRCTGCAECSFRGRQMSQKEAAEYKLIEKGIQFDQKVGRFRVQYPFIDDPRKLSNNYGQVVRIAESEEKRLAKQGLTDVANKLFDKMIDVGAVAEMTQAELDLWDGPVHYNSIQHVIDPSSTTTPLRLVTNSSLEDPRTGISLNSILAKGPKILNDMFEILIRFRIYMEALISDVSKAYYMLLTGELEKHVRRVVWRYGKIGSKWRVFVFLTVGMGDRPAACLMEVAVKMTVMIFGHIDLVAAYRLNRDRFVDDVATGGSKAEVARFKGTENVDTMVCDGTMPQIMGSTHLLLKAIATEGEKDGEKLKKLGSSVLGLGYSTERGTLMVKFKANTTTKKRGAPTGPDWTRETIGGLEAVVLTMRLSMGVANCQYDPVGLGCPLIIRLKVAMREMYRRKLTWDNPLPDDLQKHFKYLIELVVEAGDLEFRRCTRPEDSVGRCVMVVFWDGADEAFSAVIYIRWKMRSGGYHVSLLVAKSKVSAMWSTSTPRVEMDGGVMASRLTYRTIKALNSEDVPEQVWIAGDSETVLASREKDAGFFGEFYGNRIGETYDFMDEIKKMTKVGNDGEWWHVKSEDNAADRASRLDSTPADLGIGSEWQDGPSYLRLVRDEWPFERNFADRKNKVLIPKEEIVKKYRGMADTCGYINLHDLVHHSGGEVQLNIKMVTKQLDSNRELLDTDNVVEGETQKVNKKTITGEGGPGSKDNDVLRHFQYGYVTNDWEKLLNKTSLLFKWRAKVLRKRGQIASEHAMAEMFWMRVAMPATNKAGSEGKLKHLTPKKHDLYEDVIVVTGRALDGMKHYLQRDYLPVLMSATRTAQLVTLWAHGRDHAGVDVTFLTVTHVAWVVGGRALARCIKRSCIRCRYLAKLLEGQQMAVLPARLSVPCPVYSHVGIDLAGPFSVKKEGGSQVTRRNTGKMKIWVVLFVCLSTKALKLYIAGGYSTEDFMLAWNSFVADHGEPLTCHSDRGSQLVAAAKQDPDIEVPDYDWDVVAGSMKTAWHFTPAQAQFRNGAVEIYVKKFKRTLSHRFRNRMMRLLEMETALKIVASVANSRPLSARYGPKGGCDPDYLTPITPNMMLTGRANTEIPIRDYDGSTNPLVRLEYVQRVVTEWWEQFKVQNFSSLVPTQRWQLQRRNMRVGDIVLIQYSSKSSPGTYRLARVKDVEVDSVDGLVHTCTVVYSLLAELSYEDRTKYKGVTKKELRVPVQRLVLILPVEEAEVGTVAVDQEDDKGQEITDEASELEAGKSRTEVTNIAVQEGYNWDELGPGLVEHGETSFVAVKRKETQVFDLVNLDWYRSDTVATGDPSCSSTDLWLHFQCAYRSDVITQVDIRH